MTDRDDYALVSATAVEVAAPDLPYRPPHPTGRHRIALVGAGGISFAHLDAYRTHGFEVAAILSRDPAKARARADEFFPTAEVMTDYAALLARPDITVIDLTPHPAERLPLIEAALQAGKHVLNQKPFVTDLDTGHRLCDLARAQGVKLAVNQNGRWTRHMAWMRAAVRAGLSGQVTDV
ncbi:MAG: Gfo/Idh/MocA family oxidoreductase, partial [Candidatus Saccharibacteria bacterium]|nr:Gfo/Idh/MocA family oxidoreductase [Pseudorhodobacter sp.]